MTPQVEGLTDLTEIGRGGFGVVYRATETEFGRTIAIKVLAASVDDRDRARFDRERRAMGALSSHPHIVTVFRSGFTDDDRQPYLLMEYLPNGSLRDRLTESGPLPWREVLPMAINLSGALESAHRQGVLHRDVKPANVFISHLGEVKLGDFGIATMEGAAETKSGSITASIAHAAPEVIADDRPDERSDLYSLASTVHELLEGNAPFMREGEATLVPLLARIATEPPPRVRVGDIPSGFADVIEAGLAKDPDERFNNAAAFGQALIDLQHDLGLPTTRLWVEGRPPVAAPPTPTTRYEPSGRAGVASVDPVTAPSPPASATLPGVPAGPTPAAPVVVPPPAAGSGTPQPGATGNRSLLIGGAVAIVALLAIGGLIALVANRDSGTSAGERERGSGSVVTTGPRDTATPDTATPETVTPDTAPPPTNPPDTVPPPTGPPGTVAPDGNTYERIADETGVISIDVLAEWDDRVLTTAAIPNAADFEDLGARVYALAASTDAAAFTALSPEYGSAGVRVTFLDFTDALANISPRQAIDAFNTVTVPVCLVEPSSRVPITTPAYEGEFEIYAACGTENNAIVQYAVGNVDGNASFLVAVETVGFGNSDSNASTRANFSLTIDTDALAASDG